MPYCTKCDKEARPGTLFCAGCGAPIPQKNLKYAFSSGYLSQSGHPKHPKRDTKGRSETTEKISDYIILNERNKIRNL